MTSSLSMPNATEMPEESYCPKRMRKVVISGMVGNALEWYDYALYAQMAFIISELFFPGNNESVKLIATFGVFAVGFVFRPLGAIFFGYIGDRFGRRMSLVVAILMMAIPTGCIGLLPTYEQIGILAPILLTIIRIFQGMSLGGEFSGSITYIVEHAPPHRRGIAGAASLVSLIIGFLMGSFVALLFTTMLSEEDFRSWGWRVPFLLGVVIGLVGLYIRSACHESPVYEKAKLTGDICQKPIRTVMTRYRGEMMQAFCLYISVTMPFYLTSVYLLSFTQKKLGLPLAEALSINSASMIAMMITTIAAAILSDKTGRKPVLLAGLLLVALSVYPLFLLMGQESFMAVLFAQMLLGAFVGIYMASIPTVLVEMFPTSIRYTGMALAYNLAAVIFGGTAPMVCEWLLNISGTHTSLAGYVIACNLVSLAALYFYRDHYKEPLR